MIDKMQKILFKNLSKALQSISKPSYEISVQKSRQKGSASILFLMLIFTILCIGAFTVDSVRYAIIDSELKNAVASASVAERSTLTSSMTAKQKFAQSIIDFSLPTLNRGTYYNPARVSLTKLPNNNARINASVNSDFVILDSLIPKTRPAANTTSNVAQTSRGAIELVLVIDESGSMRGSMPQVRTILTNFVKMLSSMRNKGIFNNLKISIVGFSTSSSVIIKNKCYSLSSALAAIPDSDDLKYNATFSNNMTNCEVFHPLTTNMSAIISKISLLKARNMTNGAAGMYWAGKVLSPAWASRFLTQTSPYGGAKKMVVFFSDGSMSAMAQLFSPSCKILTRKKIDVYAVGTAGAKLGQMRQCSSTPDKALYANNIKDLELKFRMVFRKILQNIRLVR